MKNMKITRVAKAVLVVAGALLIVQPIITLGNDQDEEKNEEENKEYHDNNLNNNVCSLYMAPSSIPNAGYGVFTTRTIEEDDLILKPDAPNIAVLIDKSRRRSPTYDPTTDPLYLFDNVWWGVHGGMHDHMWYEATRQYNIFDYQVTFGAIPNFHPFLHNLDHIHPDIVFNDSMVNRTSPNAGSFSYYQGKEFYAGKEILAGSEIFLDYGDHWLDERGKDYDHIPRRRNYKKAGEIFESLLPHFKILLHEENENATKNTTTNNSSESIMSEQLLQLIQRKLDDNFDITNDDDDDDDDDNDEDDDEEEEDEDKRETEKERVLSLFPKTTFEVKHILQEIGSNSDQIESKGLVNIIATVLANEYTIKKHSVDFIRQHGMCLDNIMPGPSQIPGIGKGAIAQRKLIKNERIVPAPMLHLPNRKIFEREGKEELLVNYCLGHALSTMLLCPVTNAILINHCNDSQDVTCTVNAKLKWATDWDPNTNNSLAMTIEEIGKTNSDRMVAMDIVAIHDIEEGEEIFINYGDDWQEAWDDHVLNWEPLDEKCEVSEVEMNQLPKIPVLYPQDMRSDHPSMMMDDGRYFTGCKNPYVSSNYDKNRDNTTDWKSLSDDEIIFQYGIDGSSVEEHSVDYYNYWPCSVLAISKGEKVNDNETTSNNETVDDDDDDDEAYLVRIFYSRFHDKQAWYERGFPRLYDHYPREAIRYMTKPHQSDQHLPNAFRHHIGIPDDIFPEQWKNRIQNKNITE